MIETLRDFVSSFATSKTYFYKYYFFVKNDSNKFGIFTEVYISIIIKTGICDQEIPQSQITGQHLAPPKCNTVKPVLSGRSK